MLVGVVLFFATAIGLWLAGLGPRPEDPAGRTAPTSGKRNVAALERDVEQALREGRLADAELDLRTVLELQPDNLRAVRHLARALRIQGRRWESVDLLMSLVRRDAADQSELVLLGGMELVVAVPARFLRAGSVASRDPGMLLWQVNQIDAEREPRRAEAALRSVLALAPGLIEAHARLGRILATASDSADWDKWSGELPPSAENHPEIWIARACRAQMQDAPRLAARCFWEAVGRDPDHRLANYRLAQQLIALDDDKRAEGFLTRATNLQELESLLLVLDKHPEDLDRIRKVAELCESLGRNWEAHAWCQAAIAQNASLPWAREALTRLGPLVADTSERVAPSANPALQIDLSDLPRDSSRPGRPSPGVARQGRTQEAARAREDIRFNDVASVAGLHFQYKNGGDPRTGALHMYEFTGGGVAIIDFDGDGWPDVHLTQGGDWPVESDHSADLDQLFRNRGNGSFANVTRHAGVGDGGFSQGASVGDIDNDGFPDLWVANIGPNRLYRNMGDGTFIDVTDSTGTGGNEWTTSCLIADLNGDSDPDLYAVNYLGDEDVFTRVCQDEAKAGQFGICPPGIFTGGQIDRMSANLGDGRFEDVTDSAAISVAGGKGLGIVAADFFDSGRLELFIANDMDPNFFWVNQSAAPGAPIRFIDQALPLGLAFDQDGAVQACMGIAADDADGDGRLDLFVTNFLNESNTLYRQKPGDYFVDETRSANLRESSLSMLGFGTQFLDADLDGRPDLVVANGHIDDYRATGKPYQMRPQLYRNEGGGRFQEVPGGSLGAYFERLYLGRGLAKLDWNRDGREDFIVSHLDAPVALLSNDSDGPGNFLAVRLSGVTSARDAIGSKVSITAGRNFLVRQLKAGDGYQASNQRQLIFGLNDSRTVDEMRVRWPSGLEQTFRDIPGGQEIILIEGSPEAVQLPR